MRVRAAALEVHDRLVHRVAPPLARPADRPRRPQRQARCLTVRCGVVLCGNVRYSRTGWCLRRAGGLRMCESPGSVPHTGTRWALSGCERPFRAGFSDGPAELVGGHKVRPAATEPKPPLAGGRNFSAQSGVEGWRRLLGCCSDMPLPPGRSRRTVSAALERYRLPQAAWSAAEARALRAGGQWAWREGSGHGGRGAGAGAICRACHACTLHGTC